MSPDERSERGQTETCPFCGRSFKRLKSHIAHCKMAPVTKDTKISKTSQPLSGSPSAEGRNSPIGARKLAAEQGVLAGGELADLGEGARLRQNKKNSTGQEVPPGSGVKVKLKVKAKEQRRKGGEGAESRPVEHPQVRGAMLAPSERVGKRHVPVTPATAVHSSHVQTAKTPLQAASKAATPGRQSSPARPPLKTNLPKAQFTHFPEPPGGGTVAQGSRRDSFVARIQAAEGALQRPPSARTSFWEHVPNGDPLTLRRGSRRGDAWGSTKTSVWDHIKEVFSCRGTSPIPNPNPNCPPSSTLASSQDRETTRLGGACLPVNPTPSLDPQPSPLRGAERGVGRGSRCSLGLEGMPELAAAYEGIGLSVLPVRPLTYTEHVQKKAPPTHLPAPGREVLGSLTDRALMEVRLAELPDWLTSRPLLNPREAAAAVHRGWGRYYRKYIDVRRGGVGGVAMLLVGYCVLSYMWSYPHLKTDRWRKYH